MTPWRNASFRIESNVFTSGFGFFGFLFEPIINTIGLVVCRCIGGQNGIGGRMLP